MSVCCVCCLCVCCVRCPLWARVRLCWYTKYANEQAFIARFGTANNSSRMKDNFRSPLSCSVFLMCVSFAFGGADDNSAIGSSSRYSPPANISLSSVPRLVFVRFVIWFYLGVGIDIGIVSQVRRHDLQKLSSDHRFDFCSS